MSINSCTFSCPLCSAQKSRFFHRDTRREYWRCLDCALVFVPPPYFLSAEAEKAQYDLHENIEGDAGYEQFLNRLAQPLLARLSRPISILDFGCGPTPVLANILRKSGHEVRLYDFFYQREERVWSKTYEAITATEVFEHLHAPGAELARLWEHVLPDGYLAIMTKLVIDQDAFARWHYKNDPTHVCFFSTGTFRWIAQRYDAEVEFIGADVIFLQKKIQVRNNFPRTVSR